MAKTIAKKMVRMTTNTGPHKVKTQKRKEHEQLTKDAFKGKRGRKR